DNDDCQQDVAPGHKRHHHLGYFCYALNATDDDKPQQDNQADARIVHRNRKGVVSAQRDAIALHSREKYRRTQYRCDSENDAVPFYAQPFLDIKRWSATVLAILDFLVDLAEGGFNEG